VRVYFTWEELEAALARLLARGQRIALEYSEADRIPQLDRLPAGLIELVRRTGAQLVESSELATLFAAAWSEAELVSHRRASQALANVAARAFVSAVESLRAGVGLSEWGLKGQVVEMCSRAGLTEADAIIGVGPNAADGHYEPTALASAPIENGKVLLIDLWAREPGSVFADQTWMGFMGTEVPERIQQVWRAVRDARDAAVQYLEDHFGDPKHPLRGCDVDLACRSRIEKAGFGRLFNHRTGHSIGNEVHGLGPNIDGTETRDERALLPGVAFSIEPGVYVEGEFGVRSEINVHLGHGGPEVTTPKPQREIYALLDERWKSASNL
jgi:Xaa-Pro aminopeptidase